MVLGRGRGEGGQRRETMRVRVRHGNIDGRSDGQFRRWQMVEGRVRRLGGRARMGRRQRIGLQKRSRRKKRSRKRRRRELEWR